MKTVNISGVDIDIHDSGPVGITVSGGADSASLLYILLKNSQQPVHIYSFLSDAKGSVVEPYVDRVVAKCVELTGNSNIVHHKERIAVQTPKVLALTLKERIEQGEISIAYYGSTKFPPTDVINTFEEKLDKELLENRGSGTDRDVYVFDNLIYRPYINLDKKDISMLYSSLDLLESLYPLTRSCENIYSPDQHCGKCFWCEERRWGFGYLE
jgi:7-cyano-7-deazaguanine synthase in queuosine biosynthesis